MGWFGVTLYTVMYEWVKETARGEAEEITREVTREVTRSAMQRSFRRLSDGISMFFNYIRNPSVLRDGAAAHEASSVVEGLAEQPEAVSSIDSGNNRPKAQGLELIPLLQLSVLPSHSTARAFVSVQFSGREVLVWTPIPSAAGVHHEHLNAYVENADGTLRVWTPIPSAADTIHEGVYHEHSTTCTCGSCEWDFVEKADGTLRVWTLIPSAADTIHEGVSHEHEQQRMHECSGSEGIDHRIIFAPNTSPAERAFWLDRRRVTQEENDYTELDKSIYTSRDKCLRAAEGRFNAAVERVTQGKSARDNCLRAAEYARRERRDARGSKPLKQ